MYVFVYSVVITDKLCFNSRVLAVLESWQISTTNIWKLICGKLFAPKFK